MTQMSDVTVVIPCFNSEQTISRAIKSVLNQTVLPKSIVLIDDYSTDGTLFEISKLKDFNLSIDFTILKNSRNLGPGLSRNIGWDYASTEWIAFLDADDSWHPLKIELQMEFLSKYPEIDLLCSQSFLAINKTHVQEIDKDCKISKISFNNLIFKNVIPTRSVLLRKDIPFRFPSGLSEDFSLWLECLNSGYKLAKLETPLAVHYRPEYSKGGLSGSLIKHQYYEVTRLIPYLRNRPFVVTLAIGFSCLKFIRRLMINFFRRV